MFCEFAVCEVMELVQYFIRKKFSRKAQSVAAFRAATLCAFDARGFLLLVRRIGRIVIGPTIWPVAVGALRDAGEGSFERDGPDLRAAIVLTACC